MDIASRVLAPVLLAAAGAAATEEPAWGPAGEPRLLATGFQYAEGPAADEAGNLYFCDFHAGRIHHRAPGGALRVLREPADDAGGLVLTAAGELLACERRTKRVVALSREGRLLRVLAADFHGRSLGEPNDLVADRDGNVYFTDPFSESVYFLARGGEPERAVTGIGFTNGIVLSPDEHTLYVVRSRDDDVLAYAVERPGRLAKRRVFATLRRADGARGAQGGDGATVDADGNVYVATPAGIQVFAPEGEPRTVLALPEAPSNLTFGGPGARTLFVTTRTSVYAWPMRQQGHVFPGGPRAGGGDDAEAGEEPDEEAGDGDASGNASGDQR